MNNRREFIKTLLAGTGVLASGALTTAIAAGITKQSQYVLYGDGSRCDADALDAWYHGEPVQWSTGEPVGAVMYEKDFKLSRKLDWSIPPRDRTHHVYITYCNFFTPDYIGNDLFKARV